MPGITLEQAKTIINKTFAEGTKLGLKPLSVLVLDQGGHPVAFERQDKASNQRFQIALGKAGGALALGVSSRKIGEMAVERPQFVASLGSILPSGAVPAAGGVIFLDDYGQVLGAVGATGDTSDNDELCALAGIAGAGLNAQT